MSTAAIGLGAQNAGNFYGTHAIAKTALGQNGPESPAQHKLREAAAQFESMLLASLWKAMKSSSAGDDDDSADPAHESLEDWGIQAMSSAVGKAGGLGIANVILKHLEPKIGSSQIGKVDQPGKGSGPAADNSP